MLKPCLLAAALALTAAPGRACPGRRAAKRRLPVADGRLILARRSDSKQPAVASGRQIRQNALARARARIGH
jgi:hypothetical protein